MNGKGQIYDPKSGKTYRSVVYKGKSGSLVVKGCIGPFCQAQQLDGGALGAQLPSRPQQQVADYAKRYTLMPSSSTAPNTTGLSALPMKP